MLRRVIYALVVVALPAALLFLYEDRVLAIQPPAATLWRGGLGVLQAAVDCLGEKIAFTSNRDLANHTPREDGGEIYLMNPDGSNVERVTDNLVLDAFPDLRGDGKRIVFDSNRLRTPGDPILRSDLFLMKTDGSEQTFLTPGSSADWSPDGKSVTYHASVSGSYDPIRPDPGAPTADSDIFTLKIAALEEGATPVNLSNTAAEIEDDPNWSPDGTKIVYTSHDAADPNQNQPGSAEISVIHADGLGAPQRLTFNTSEERAPAWSPDGSRIVFMCRYGGPDFEICIMNADGSGLVQVTSNTLQELSIRWSVDGQRLYFNRPLAPGRQQLFSINVDGTGETQVTDTPVGTNVFPAPGFARGHCRLVERPEQAVGPVTP
jgi:Tol biopolymer transport system component